MHVLIVSGNTLIRNGIQHILQQSVDNICSFSSDSAEALEKIIEKEKFNILFFDKSNRSIFQQLVLKQIKQKFPFVKIAVLSSLENSDEILESMEIGVEAYLTYDCDQDEIQKTVASLNAGEKYYCQKVLASILEVQQPKNLGLCKAFQLTDRETEIARLIAQGNTNKQIAEMLCISPHTVHTHRKSLMKKMGVSSAMEVARVAQSEGLIS